MESDIDRDKSTYFKELAYDTRATPRQLLLAGKYTAMFEWPPVSHAHESRHINHNHLR